jgi:transposase
MTGTFRVGITADFKTTAKGLLEPVLAESDYAGAFTETLARFRRRTMLVVLTDLVEEAVNEWLENHPRFRFYFTPTGSSWINMVERLFSKLTTERIRRGVFKSVDNLEAAIVEWINVHNTDPRPFKWTKSAQEIIRKVEKYRRTYDALH